MRSKILVFAFWGAVAGTALAAERLPVIFDTDMESDCDDDGALAMLHALVDQGEVQILATPVSARHRWSGPCVDAESLATGSRLSQLPADNPIRRVFELYFGGVAKNRHNADQIAVMVAVRGTGAPWKLVTAGHNHIFENGTHQWQATPDNPTIYAVKVFREPFFRRVV